MLKKLIKVVDVVNELKLQVIDEFMELCKQFTNGNVDFCYQDLLNKIQYIEIRDTIKIQELLDQIFLI